MGGDIATTKQAISEALSDADTTLTLTHQLTPLHEASLDASVSTYSSLEAAASGLSRFLEKSSRIEQALGAEDIDSNQSLAIAYENRESAIEAGKETVVELGLAFTGFTTITAKTKEMQAYFDGESGVRELLKKAAKTATAALASENREFTGKLTQSVSYATFLSSQFNAGIRAASFGEKSLPDITERLKEAVMSLMKSKDMPAHQLDDALRAVQSHVTSEDRKEIIELIRGSKDVKSIYAFYIPNQQRELKQIIQTAVELGTQVQDRL